jgi:lysophospholipase L1-like esterase
MVTEDGFNYRAYAEKMVDVIKSLKKSFPQASFLLLSVSDRSSNTSGKFKTMHSIPAMRDAQRLIAQRTGIAFWDMFEAMGGENSMVKFTEAEPPLGARDYTHLTFRGGKKLAGSLAKSLLFEKKKYDARRKK